jgi:histidinol-phosphate aminotransferase
MSTWPQWLPLREELAPMSAYGAPQVSAEASLNTNENPYSPSPALIKAIADRVSQIGAQLNRYPDREATELRTSLARYINSQSATDLDVANVWAANGSNEIIQSIFLAFGRKSALGFTPSYSMHPLIAKVTATPWIDGTRRKDFTLDCDAAIAQIESLRPALTFITTPNNPTGSAVLISEIESIAKSVQSVGGLLVIDEAYAEFSSEKSAVTLIQKYPQIVVIRTMSKAFAFAGARVGYLIAHPSVIDAMRLVRLPYHLSALTQVAASAALEYSEELLATVAGLIAARENVASQLTQMGLEVVPSCSNFLLFSGFKRASADVWKDLLDQGVLIRDVGLEGYLRVTIGNDAENKKFLSALQDVLNK